MLYLLLIASVLGLSSAKHIDFKPYNETAMAMFFTSDGDHDGIFTRTELDHVFVVYDTDGDGRVSRHEYTVHITALNPELHDFAHVLYDDYDMNNDHHLDKPDYDAYFAKVDANGDGGIDPNEFVAYWTKLYGGGQVYWWMKSEYPEKITNLPQVTGKLYHIIHKVKHQMKRR